MDIFGEKPGVDNPVVPGNAADRKSSSSPTIINPIVSSWLTEHARIAKLAMLESLIYRRYQTTIPDLYTFNQNELKEALAPYQALLEEPEQVRVLEEVQGNKKVIGVEYKAALTSYLAKQLYETEVFKQDHLIQKIKRR